MPQLFKIRYKLRVFDRSELNYHGRMEIGLHHSLAPSVVVGHATTHSCSLRLHSCVVAYVVNHMLLMSNGGQFSLHWLRQLFDADLATGRYLIVNFYSLPDIDFPYTGLYPAQGPRVGSALS